MKKIKWTSRDRARLRAMDLDTAQNLRGRLINALFALSKMDPRWMIWLEREINPRWDLQRIVFNVEARARTLALKPYSYFHRKHIGFLIFRNDQPFTERGATTPKERMETLQAFHKAGIFTWVSLEPTLDTDTSLQIVRETHEFVDFYKIGRANYLPMTKTTDWKTYTEKMVELCQSLGVKHYIKKDLQPFLPEGYHNPKIIPQHN